MNVFNPPLVPPGGRAEVVGDHFLADTQVAGTPFDLKMTFGGGADFRHIAASKDTFIGADGSKKDVGHATPQ